MGPTISVNKSSSEIQQKVINDITQRTSQQCGYSCTNSASGNDIIVSGSRIKGSLDVFNFTCHMDVSCSLSNSSTANLTSILGSTVKQKNTPASGGLGFTLSASVNQSDIVENTLNNITQITQSTCNTSAVNDLSNNYFVLANSEVGGNVAFGVADSNIQGNCTIKNLSNAVAYNNTQADANQENTDSGIWTMIITVIIILLVVGAVISIFSVGIRSVSGGKEKDSLTPQQIDTISTQLAGV